MFITKLKRIVKAGFINFWRNGFVSLSSVLVMTVTLFVIGSTIFFGALLESSLEQIKNKVDINVYFVTSASEEDILTVKKSLEALPEISKVEYVSRDQALTDFKKRHENDELTLQALSELPDNPLGAVLNINAKETSQYEGIATFLSGKSSVLLKDGKSVIDKVNFYQNKVAIDKLTKIIDSSRVLGIGLALILAIISIIIAFNTVRLIIYISREEISVMKLVGASNKYIRGPFMVSGTMYGLTAGILTLIIFFPLTYWLGDMTEKFFTGVNIWSYYMAHLGEMIFILIGVGGILGAVSSFFAVRRYLNV